MLIAGPSTPTPPLWCHTPTTAGNPPKSTPYSLDWLCSNQLLHARGNEDDEDHAPPTRTTTRMTTMCLNYIDSSDHAPASKTVTVSTHTRLDEDNRDHTRDNDGHATTTGCPHQRRRRRLHARLDEDVGNDAASNDAAGNDQRRLCRGASAAITRPAHPRQRRRRRGLRRGAFCYGEVKRYNLGSDSTNVL